MKKELKLENPILIDNEKVESLTYDIEEITAALFATADVKKKRVAGLKNVSISIAVEFDYSLHLYMGMAAVIAVNPDYEFEDIERVKGRDVLELMEIGRSFFMKSAVDSHQNSSEKESETTPEPIEQA